MINYQSVGLGYLGEPLKSRKPMDISGLDEVELLQFYENMYLIRTAEAAVAQGRKTGVVGGPVHLSTGQEAIAVGVAKNLNNADKVFGAHRSHAHVISLGVALVDMFAEILGKPSGLSRGMGGSMHLQNVQSGFLGSVPIVAGTVPLAVGAAHAAKLKGESFVAVVFLGDGAAEEGVFHESLNLARVLQVPVLFVIENNLFSSHMHISLRQPNNRVSRFAESHDIKSCLVDGNDIAAVSKAAKELVSYARSTMKPVFMEAVTYRWFGHVDWRDDTDVGVNRSEKDLAAWRKLDPIKRLRDVIEMSDAKACDKLNSIEAEVDLRVTNAWEEALERPKQSDSIHIDRVYNK